MLSKQKQSRCQVCHRTCRPLRCTRCQNAFYCSTKCQKVDWKSGGHKKSCSPNSTVVMPKNSSNSDGRAFLVHAALKELHSLAQGLSIGQLQEQYHKAHDEAERQHQFQKEKASAAPTVKAAESPTIESAEGGQVNSTCEQGTDTNGLIYQPGSKIAPENFGYEIMVEKMHRISRYQINLKPIQSSRLISSQSFELSVSSLGQSRSLVSISSHQDGSVKISFELPNVVLQSSNPQPLGDKDGTIQFRVAYENEDWDDNTGHVFDNSESRHRFPTLINSMQCRFCGLALLPPSTIDRVVPLPTGYWDEIADYLICYSGQPVVDFTSSGAHAQNNVAMQDSNVVCLHKDDVGPSVCILAVNGYGEEDENSSTNTSNGVPSSTKDDKVTSINFRGNRGWVDAVGGATICCSICCSPLGFASLESPITYRFLKHRFSVYTKEPNGSEKFTCAPMSLCSSFVAREMVRYAETKAIFTFIVGVDSSDPATKKRCLLLRVLSWDAVLAASYESRSSQRLNFDRVAKIVYEETSNKLVDGSSASSWVWGGVDLCCPPPQINESRTNADNNASQNSEALPLDWTKMKRNPTNVINNAARKSAVRLQLPLEEWEEVRSALLEGSRWFSKSISDATILVTMGQKSATEGGDIGLSAIPLNS